MTGLKHPLGLLRSATISMMEFRSQPGEYIRAVERGRQSFTLTRAGVPVARLVPMGDAIVVASDGTVYGDVENLGPPGNR